MTVQILRGDCRQLLKTRPSDSVHCCVTSPPYWGLRSYLPDGHPEKHLEIGSEPTLEAWVQTMVEVFREVRRVLRPDGTLWLNLGDAYAGQRAPGGVTASARRDDEPIPRSDRAVPGLKPKDMMGQPWRVAFALQADGWWLRQEIIWHKPNPMPESTRDRCTKAHEHVFLLSKGEWTGAVLPIACSDVDAAWLAALIDGEGSIGIGQTSNGSFAGHVHISNSCMDLLHKAARICGVGSVLPSGKGVNFPMFRWQVTGPSAAAVLYRVLPFLIAKRRQADCVLELQESKRRYGGSKKPDELKAREADLWRAAKAFNKRDPLAIEVEANSAKWRGGTYFYDFDAMQEPVTGGANPRTAGNKTHKHTAAYEAGDEHMRTKAGLLGYDERQAAKRAARRLQVKGWATEGRHEAQDWARGEAQGKYRGNGVGFGHGTDKEARQRERVAGVNPKASQDAAGSKQNESFSEAISGELVDTRNPRSVWTIPTHGFKGAHFATFPPALAERCITAGCPEGGTVLDPFGGSGTVGMVADRQHKSAILIDLDERNVPMARDRIEGDAGLFAEVLT